MKKIAYAVLLFLIIALAGCQKGVETDPAVLEKFKEFAGKEDFAFTAEYDVLSQGSEFKMTQYFKDANNIRTDMDINIDGGEIRSYILDKRIYSCSIRDGSWFCIKFEGEQMETMQDAFDDIEEHPEKYQISYEGEKEFLGDRAYCFKIRVPELMSIATEECFNIEGVPVYMAMGTLLQMTAMSYELEVSDSDFELQEPPEH